MASNTQRRASISFTPGPHSFSASGDGGSSVDTNSVSSSVASMDRKHQEKLFIQQDDAKLKEMMRFFTTLDFASADAMDPNDEESTQNKKYTQKAMRNQYQNVSSSGSQLKQLYKSFERIVIRRLYKINHVILLNQAVSVGFYHLVLLFEYIQLLFFIFYKVPIYNDFVTDQNYIIDTSLQNQTFTNQTQSFGSVQSNQNPFYSNSDNNSIRLDQLVAFINFQIYALQDSTGQTFVVFYTILITIFMIFLVLLFALADSLFEASKQQEIKEGTKILLKFMSIMMTLYLFLFQIPLMVILLQGYQCEEDPNEQFTITDIQCNGTTHNLMMIFSTVTLTLYTAFLITQQYLFTMTDFESPLPWASFEKMLSVVRCSYKLILTASFVFDKAGAYRAEMGLVCFAISVYTCQQRFQGSILFHRSIQQATILYETLAAWLFISIAIHVAGNQPITMTEFGVILSCSVFTAIFFLQAQEVRKKNYLLTNSLSRNDKFTNAKDWQLYFFRFHDLIESQTHHAWSLVLGIFFDHFDHCMNANCQCKLSVESFDRLRQYLIIKDKHKAEEALFKKFTTEVELAEGYDRINNIPSIMTNAEDKMPVDMPVEQVVSNQQMDLLTIVRTKPYARRLHQNSLKKQRSSRYNVLEQVDSQGSINLEYKSPPSFYRSATFNDTQQQNNLEILRFHYDVDGPMGYDMDYQKRQVFKFFTQLIKDATDLYPSNIDLRIIGAEVYLSKLKNEFKAIFELMSCELYSPSIYDKFIIFRKKLDIEQLLYQNYQKMNMKQGFIDVTQVFKYQQLYLKFQLHEYLTVMATQSFWRELLGKHIDASNLQKQGKEISKNFLQLSDIVKSCKEIYPEDIKLLCRYGFFLMNVVNNEQDAINFFEQAQSIFQTKVFKKKQANCEQQVFGENCAASIIVMSATAAEMGRIIDVNEELEHMLGYSRKEMIGQNIRKIIPTPIAKVHDQLIQRYFETARPTVIEIQRQSFAANKDGYLREVQLLVKVYPLLTNQILFVGFIQRGNKFDDIQPPKQDYHHYDFSYIITDQYGNISNVSEHLNVECGLHAKFFYDNGSAFQQKINIVQLFPEINQFSIQEGLMQEGSEIRMDTRQILNFVELEMLNSEEIIEVKSCLGIYKCFIQHKELQIDPKFCIINVYRVIVLSRLNEESLRSVQNLRPTLANLNGQDESEYSSRELDTESGLQEGNSFAIEFEMGSVASSNASQVSFSSVVKDFKRTLGEKRTPKNVILLNRLLMLFLLSAIILQFIDYYILRSDIESLLSESHHNLHSEKRRVKQSQLAVNVRSMINVANGLEADNYDIPGFSRIQQRFEYLSNLVQTQAEELHEVHEFMTQQRQDMDSGDNKLQSNFEYRSIELYRLDDFGRVSRYYQPYRIAFNSFLNEVLMLNMTEKKDVIFKNQKLLKISPQDALSLLEGTNSTEFEKTSFFLMANGLRNLRTRSFEATAFQQEKSFANIQNLPYLIIMVIAIITTVVCLLLLMFYLWQIEKVQAEILSLYAHLHLVEVELVFKRCNNYFHELNNGTLIKNLMDHCNFNNLEKKNQSNLAFLQSQMDNATPEIAGIKSVKLALSHKYHANGPSTNLHPHLQFQNQPSNKSSQLSRRGVLQSAKTVQMMEDSQVSEEEKEEFFLKKYIKQKHMHRFQKNIHQNRDAGSYPHTSKDFYEDLINSSFQYVKDIADVEEQSRNNANARPQGVFNFTKQFKKTFATTYLKNQIFNQKTKKSKDVKDLPALLKATMARGQFASAASIFKMSMNQSMLKVHKSEGKQKDVPAVGAFKMRASIEKMKNSSANLVGGSQNQIQEIEEESKSDEETQSKSAHGRERKIQIEEEILEDESSESNNLDFDDDFDDKKKRAKQYTLNDHAKEQKKKENNQASGPEINRLKLTDDEIAYRKNSFFRTIRVQNWTSKVSILLTAALFCAYFLQLFFYHQDYLSKVKQLYETIPVFYNRFTYLMLAFAIMKERIILNNSLYSFEKDSDYGYNIDYMFMDLSSQVEKRILELKQKSYAIDKLMLDLFYKTDSQNFCTYIETEISAQSKFKKVSIPYIDSRSIEQSKSMYQGYLNSIIRACQAAEEGNVQTLQYLQGRGVDLNKGNYDLQTPLHLAVMNQRIEAVQFLIQVAGVMISSQDRWGATPLNYVGENKSLEKYLKDHGATLGVTQNLKNQSQIQKLTDDQVRMYYAAFYGDQRVIVAMILLGNNINIIDRNGRTRLHIAASEGQTEVCQLLITLGSDIIITDNRGEDPVFDALRENHIETHEYLDSLILGQAIEKHCVHFADEIFAQGVHSAIANFHKKFSDLQIRVDKATSYQERLDLLKSNQTKPLMKSIGYYFQAQELYLHYVLRSLDTAIQTTYENESASYSSITQTIFFISLIAYVGILLGFRRSMVSRLKDETLQSRGILNLIPNAFFEQNKALVQGLIVKIQE